MSIVRYSILSPGALPPAALDWLGPAERDVFRRLRIEKRRVDWLLARYAGKRLLARELGIPSVSRELARIEILAADDGAPEVWVDRRRSPPTISISHSSGRALCAVTSAGVALGCDVESIAPRSDAFVETFFLESERALVAGAEPSARPLLATLLWSAKESALKAIREGLRRDTRSMEVTLPDDGDSSSRPAATVGDPGSWQAVRILDRTSNRTFPGWWCRSGGAVVTICASPAPAVPELAEIERASLP